LAAAVGIAQHDARRNCNVATVGVGIDVVNTPRRHRRHGDLAVFARDIGDRALRRKHKRRRLGGGKLAAGRDDDAGDSDDVRAAAVKAADAVLTRVAHRDERGCSKQRAHARTERARARSNQHCALSYLNVETDFVRVVVWRHCHCKVGAEARCSRRHFGDPRAVRVGRAVFVVVPDAGDAAVARVAP
jgi:hypothetical protein